MGAGELIVLLLALSGFGVAQNPNAPTSQEVLKYAPAADVMIHVDLEAVVPNNWAKLVALPDDPTIKAVPELADEIRGMVQMAKGGVEMAKGTIGFDPIQDLDSVTAWAQYGDKGDPSFLIVARGQFPLGVIDKMQPPDPSAKKETIDGRTFLSLPDGQGLGQAADGAILFGTAGLVKARVGAKWSPAKPKKGSLGDRSAAWIDAKPFLLMTSAPSAVARKRVMRDAKDEDTAVFREILLGQDFMAIGLSWNGVSWIYDARESGGFDNAVLASEGTVSLLRAGHHATRGIAQILLAALPAYASYDKSIPAIVRKRADILKLVWSFSGDGNFVAQVDKNAADKSVTVQATGKSLSEVVPMIAVALPAAAAYFVFARAVSTIPEPAELPPYEPKSEPKSEPKPVKPVKPKAR
jgi:hypothetical protein